MAHRLLIADDEPHVVRVLRRALERVGYEIEAVHNGADALERVLCRAPDVLITDIQMPRMTGEILCQRIDELIPEREFLILVLTSRTEIEHREWSSAIANIRFLEKPVSVHKLVSLLEHHFAAGVASA